MSPEVLATICGIVARPTSRTGFGKGKPGSGSRFAACVREMSGRPGVPAMRIAGQKDRVVRGPRRL